jgi:ribosomal protein S27AE
MDRALAIPAGVLDKHQGCTVCGATLFVAWNGDRGECGICGAALYALFLPDLSIPARIPAAGRRRKRGQHLC